MPPAWDKAWEGPEQSLPWLRGAVGRTLALEKWMERDRAGTVLTSSLRLSELFHPPALLTVRARRGEFRGKHAHFFCGVFRGTFFEGPLMSPIRCSFLSTIL